MLEVHRDLAVIQVLAGTSGIDPTQVRVAFEGAPLEIPVGDGWLGLRSHPRPIGSVTFGGPSVPDWLDDTLREIVGAPGPATGTVHR